jgi:hypothetical protein
MAAAGFGAEGHLIPTAQAAASLSSDEPAPQALRRRRRTAEKELIMRLLTAALAVVFALSLAIPTRPLHARPVFDTSCSSCHSPATERMEATNHQAVLDPGAGSLKTYIVNAGSSARLTARVNDGAQRYAVQFKDLGLAGIQNPANQMVFTADASWIEWGSPSYYITTTLSTTWAGTPHDWDFDLLVSEFTPPDFYRLQFTVSGIDGDIWTQSEPFYLQVLPVPEPASLAAAAIPLAAVLLRRRRDRGIQANAKTAAENAGRSR